jgi:hypothetical protein
MTRTSVPLLAAALLATLLAATPRPAAAVWPHDPNIGNVPLCTATNTQSYPMIVADGTGGVIVTWQDDRGATTDIYVQRISAAGAVQWAANGVALCTATGNQYIPTIVSDGAGGAIVTWEDARSGIRDIYAQRISAAGAVQWTANGVALCTATGVQGLPTIASDGAGGAIVSWQDLRGGVTNDIYAQRISAGGAVQWLANGVALCTATGEQQIPTITSDGAGGAVVTWRDYRSGTNHDIYAQRISAGGAVQWLANGVVLCIATDAQSYPMIVADGAGGAIVAWQDYRSGTNNDIYAQRISAAGAVQWLANGVALCTATGNQYGPTLVSDGFGGAIVTWYDYRSGTNYDIYAQRVSAAGAIQWTANGVALCTATDDQSSPMIAADGAGGAIVTWQDPRSGTNYDIYAQRISAAGAVQWTANGVALCTAAGTQNISAAVADGSGGAIVTWQDLRSGTGDIYAQRIERYGQLGNAEPAITKVKDVPNDQGGFVKVSWDASYLDVDPVYGVSEYRVFRSAPVFLTTRAASRRAVTKDSDVAVREGALLARESAGATVYWEYVGTQAAEAFAGYSRVVATTSDSIAGSNPRTLFMVEARASTSLSADRWASSPDSGYSVDNLAPLTPSPFTGQYAAGTATLHWAVNPAADLAEYRLYRGSTAGFVPGPANLVVAQPDTGYVDAAGATFYYKLCAVDVHGNVSGFSTLLPSGTVDVAGAALPRAVFLAPPAPNPARGAATLRFGLPRAARVELALYDQQGRRMRSLLSGTQPAGERTITWNGSDDDGRALPAGLYFVRLATEGRTFISRLAVIR